MAEGRGGKTGIHEGSCSQVSRLNCILSQEPSQHRHAVDHLCRKGAGMKGWGRCEPGHAVKTSRTEAQSSVSTWHASCWSTERLVHGIGATSVLFAAALFPVKHMETWHRVGPVSLLTAPTLNLILG